jgi:hypothetical protein
MLETLTGGPATAGELAALQPDEHFIEVTLAADGDQTILVWEERGMPLDYLAAYGAGIQVHVEDLAAHLAGRERCDAETRWNELFRAYQALPADARLVTLIGWSSPTSGRSMMGVRDHAGRGPISLRRPDEPAGVGPA